VDDRKRTFRFGVVGEGIRSGPELVATARRAEELGYDTLLLRDHFVAAPFGDQLAPMVALMAAAAATRTLRVGTLVLDNDYRHPVLLAKEAATLDLLSGGRFELGIGAGWARDEYERAGMAFDPPGIRVDRLEEAVRVLKGLFAGSALTFPGHHYSVTELQSFPMPAQRPHPPILIGAGSTRMLSIAGREADIVRGPAGPARPLPPVLLRRLRRGHGSLRVRRRPPHRRLMHPNIPSTWAARRARQLRRAWASSNQPTGGAAARGRGVCHLSTATFLHCRTAMEAGEAPVQSLSAWKRCRTR